MSTEAVESTDEVPERIKKYLDWLTVLPDAGEKWVRSDAPNALPFRKLRNEGLIEQIEEMDIETEGRSRWKRQLYTVTGKAQRALEDAERYTPCTCGHAGLHNAGDHFECAFELCENQDQREDLELQQ